MRRAPFKPFESAILSPKNSENAKYPKVSQKMELKVRRGVIPVGSSPVMPIQEHTDRDLREAIQEDTITDARWYGHISLTECVTEVGEKYVADGKVAATAS